MSPRPRSALRVADDRERQTQRFVEDAIELAGHQEALVDGVITALTSAAVEAQRDSRRLAPYARADIRDVLELPDAIPGWPTADEQWSEPGPLVAAAAEVLEHNPDAGLDTLPSAVSLLHQGDPGGDRAAPTDREFAEVQSDQGVRVAGGVAESAFCRGP